MSARGWRIAVDNLSVHGGDAEFLGDVTIDTASSLIFEERSTADSAEAGKGKLWVRDDTPNVLVFTDDAGTDTDVGSGGGDVVDDTTPQLGGQLDVNGNAIGDGTLELLKFSETASAVNEITIANAAAMGKPSIQATGDDADVSMEFLAKADGTFDFTTTSPTQSRAQFIATSNQWLLGTDSGGAFIFRDVDDSNFEPLILLGTQRVRVNGGLAIGTSTWGASADGVLAIANGTQGAATANAVQITSEDLSAGNTILSMQTEGSGVLATGTPAAADGAIAIKVNGTVRYLTYSDTAPS